jgi:hypothetical protein
MFGLLALSGDLGCLTGPVIAGAVAGALGGNLKIGFLLAMTFPVVLAFMVLLLKRLKKSE